MASSFKTLLNDDVVNTRTLLHEAIPITGTIASGTYQDAPGTELAIKNFSHGMFQSVYDYPYLSSSANHIFDLTYGCSSNASSSVQTQNAKKLNIYNQMAQVLIGYDSTGSIRKFDSDGEIDGNVGAQTYGVGFAPAGTMNQCFFLNMSRLLTKDEIKKGSFRIKLFTSGTINEGAPSAGGRSVLTTYGDFKSVNEYRTSPAGDYGLIVTSSTSTNDFSVGLIFYQAGIVVLTSSVFQTDFGVPGNFVTGGASNGTAPTSTSPAQGRAITQFVTSSTIDTVCDAFRHRLYNIDFNNTIELNSAIYFCRINHNEFNYSANPTYVTASKLRVKNTPTDLPLSYITTVGLYAADNELLAVAKLSEPIRKDPNTELTLRVRLDY